MAKGAVTGLPSFCAGWIVDGFLPQLFAYAPENLFGYTWTLFSKYTETFLVPRATEVEQACAGRQDVYVGVSLSSRGLSRNERVTNDTSAGIVGLWADVDVAGPCHSNKKALPPTQADALSVVLGLPRRPTVIVDSGHGLQPWWLFKEALVFADAGERAHAAGLARGWQDFVRAQFQKYGWTMDATADLARVLRVPGTVNAKDPTRPVPVRVLTGEWDLRYEPADFGKYGTPEKVDAGEAPATAPEAPEATELYRLLQSNRGAKLGWERKHTTNDTSNSGQDFQLARAAASAGWSKGQIVWLLIECGRFNGEAEKRPGYYTRTADSACDAVASDRERLEVSNDLEHLCSNGDGVEDRGGEIRRHIEQLTGVRVLRVVRHMATRAIFRLVIAEGCFTLGNVEALYSQERFRVLIFEWTKKLPKALKRKQWETVAQGLMDLAEDEGADEEANENTAGAAWLRDYLTDFRPRGTLDDATVSWAPFREGGRVGIFLKSFLSWLKAKRDTELNRGKLGSLLRQLGCEPVKENCRLKDGTRTSCFVWWLPANLSSE